eukprot:TRINITY_DN64987_c0_g1_i1.p1 TRINITY_DN64987_c0_g1~~TRINITY_DN64987_c0_g1_i1.p1  ORF type:complete len:537 (+),score=112.91 TRINITY_DN64987_c0_g1_i1:92-1702(+)
MSSTLAGAALRRLADAGAPSWDGSGPRQPRAVLVAEQLHTEAFVRRMRRVAAERGAALAAPRVVYHWTPEANFSSIVRDNLRVPKEAGSKQRLLYGRGVYACARFRCEGNTGGVYGKGAQGCVLLLALPGKQYEATAGVDGDKPLVRGFDTHLFIPHEGTDEDAIFVFFSSDQLLPCFIVDSDGVEDAERAASAAAAELCAGISSVPLLEQAAPVEALGIPAQAGPIRKGARVVVKQGARGPWAAEHTGGHGVVHSVFLDVADRLWACVWMDPRAAQKHPARFRIDDIEVEPGSAPAPPLREWRFSTALRFDSLPLPPQLGMGASVPYGIMAPEGVLEGTCSAPLPVVVALPGGHMDHVSEFYRAWCAEERGWVVVVPYRPSGSPASLFSAAPGEFVEELVRHISARVGVEGGAPHWVGRCNGAQAMLHLCGLRPQFARSLAVITGGFAEGEAAVAVPSLRGVPVAFYEPDYNENQGTTDHRTWSEFGTYGHEPPAELFVHEGATARDIDRCIDMDAFWERLERLRRRGSAPPPGP